MGAEKWSKHPYFIFAFLFVLNISVFVISIFIYIFLFKSAANIAMRIIPLVIPIAAFGFGFYNVTRHFRDIREHYKEIKIEKEKENEKKNENIIVNE